MWQHIGEVTDPILAGNNLKTVEAVMSVPQTDTGRQGEKPKARERTLVKELGKMTP